MTLSPRQEEIVDRITDGESVKSIATDLKLDVKTVYWHIHQVAGRIPGSDPPTRRVIRWRLTTRAA